MKMWQELAAKSSLMWHFEYISHFFFQKRSHHGIFESIEAGIMDVFSKKIKNTPISLTLADLFLNLKCAWKVKPL